MIKTFFREVLRVSKPTTSNVNVAVMMAFVMGLAAVGCGSSNSSNHTHSGEDIDRGTVSESRIDASIARDSEIMPTVKDNDGSGSGQARLPPVRYRQRDGHKVVDGEVEVVSEGAWRLFDK